IGEIHRCVPFDLIFRVRIVDLLLLEHSVVESSNGKRNFRYPLRSGEVTLTPTLDQLAYSDQRVPVGHFERKVKCRPVVERVSARVPACASADREVSAARV